MTGRASAAGFVAACLAALSAVGSFVAAPFVAAPFLAGAAFTRPALAQAAAGDVAPAAGAATLTVELDPLEITVGDRVEAALTLRPAAAGSPLPGLPAFPVWQERWGDAEILAAELPTDEGGGVWRQRLTLTVFEPGVATLPAIEVRMPTATETSTVASQPQALQVRSVLPAGAAEAAPQPPAPLVAQPVGERFWWAMAVLGLACLLLAYFVLRKASEIRRTLATLALGPFEAWGRALARLRREADVERLVTGLSLELRRYLGRAVGFHAAEGTSTEIQRGLRERRLPPELVRETMGLLREADAVKFARREADREWAERRLDDAGELARRVEKWLEPEQPTEAAP